MSSTSDDDQQPKRKKRPPMYYKKYLGESSVEVPRTTLLTSKRRDLPPTVVPVVEDSAAEGQACSSSLQNITHASQEDYQSCASEESDEPQSNLSTSSHPRDLSTTPGGGDSDESPSDHVHSSSTSSESSSSETSQVGEDNGETPAALFDFDGQFASRARQLNGQFSLNDKMLFQGEDARKTKFECLLLVLSFAFRHGLTDVATEDLLKLINFIVGESIPDSLHNFHRVFAFECGLEYHFYCSKCEAYIGKKSDFGKNTKFVQCPVDLCGNSCNISNFDGQNFFVILPLEHQLKCYLESRHDIMDSLAYRFTREQSDYTIRDIFDGELYKRLAAEGNILSDAKNFSLTVNVDGTPVFLSNTKSLWPIFCRINETKPSDRFSSENMFLGGLWFGSSHPNMTLYLSKFTRESRKLEVEGFKWRTPTGEDVTSKVVIANGVFDSVAKPDAQRMKQYNAYESCGYCYHPGDLVDLTHNVLVVQPQIPAEQTEPGNSAHAAESDPDVVGGESESDDAADPANLACDMGEVEDAHSERPVRKIVKQVRFTYSKGGLYPERTNEEMRADMTESVETDQVVRGVKGMSAFVLCGFFNLVYGFAIDYMHGVLLGVTKLLLSLWLDSKFHQADHYIRGKITDIDKRLLKLKPPTNISRRPQSVKNYSRWKANELRSWLLYYCLPCLDGILPDKYFRHLGLLVESIYILSSDHIRLAELNKVQNYLIQFVKDFETLYGPAHMVYNVHLLTHLTQCVRYWGPLWAYSAFSFESGIGNLKKLVKGTRGVISQITRKYCIYRFLPKVVATYEVRDNVADYCKDLLIVRKRCRNVEKVMEITLYESSLVPVRDDIRLFLNNSGVEVDVPMYQRFIFNGVPFYSKTYTRPKEKSNDFTIRLKDGSYGVIEVCFVSEKKVFLVVRSLETSPNTFIVQNGMCKAPHIKVCSMYMFGTLKLVSVNDLSVKCLFLETGNGSYVTVSPNSCEKD